jgi:hypothetical protein|tara:strand:- start:695 stop:949 length:255 start_codon:yes stop_codon:yes gene_type:complete
MVKKKQSGNGTPQELVDALPDLLAQKIRIRLVDYGPSYWDHLNGVTSEDKANQGRQFMLDMFALTQTPVTRKQFRERVKEWIND